MAGWLASSFTSRMRGFSRSSSCNAISTHGRVSIRPRFSTSLLRCVPLLLFAVALECPAQQDTAEQHATRASQFVAAGDMKKAEVELRRAVELAPTNPTFLSALGTVLANQHKLPETAVWFEKALKIDPKDLGT